MEDKFGIPWADRASAAVRLLNPPAPGQVIEGDGADGGTGEAPAPPNRNKIKYSHECSTLGAVLNVWGKPELPLV